jgi:hypothetical protein
MLEDLAVRGQAIDVLQTATLAVIAAAVIYIVIRLERALSVASGSLTQVLETLRTNSERLDALERSQGDLETAWRLQERDWKG